MTTTSRKPTFVAIRKDQYLSIGRDQRVKPSSWGRSYFILISTGLASHKLNCSALKEFPFETNAGREFVMTPGYQAPDLNVQGDLSVGISDVPASIFNVLTNQGFIDVRMASSGEDLAAQLHALAKHEAAMRPAACGRLTDRQPCQP